MKHLGLWAAGITASVAGLTSTAAYLEAHAYTVRRRSLLVVGDNSRTHTHFDSASTRDAEEAAQDDGAQAPSLRILHLSDIHMTAHQRHKRAWLEKLADSNPDLLILTGDQLSEPAGYPALIEALTPLAGIPGVFVFGSHDYFSAKPAFPLSYLWRKFRHSEKSEKKKEENTLKNLRDRDLPWREMTSAFEDFGWINLNNARARLLINGWDINFVGVDDPHIHHDKYPELPPGSASPASGWTGKRFHIGVCHAPYQHILERFSQEGCDFVASGHTHGGQVCLPGGRAIVSNCDIPPEFASGLFPWPLDKSRLIKNDGAVVVSSLNNHPMWVNISAGLGSSPYAPWRTFCRPEAVQLDVIEI